MCVNEKMENPELSQHFHNERVKFKDIWLLEMQEVRNGKREFSYNKQCLCSFPVHFDFFVDFVWKI